MIVAFTGKKGSGKSTAAGGLPSHFVPLAFATPVRQICHEILGFTHEEMNDPEKKETVVDRWPHTSPRRAMQIVGTDFFRTSFPGTWIESMRRQIHSWRDAGVSNFSIQDLRFPDEADFIRSEGGIIIRVVRPGSDDSDRHASETELTSIFADVVLYNQGSVEDLQNDVALVYHARQPQ